METKTVTIRMSKELASQLEQEGDSLNRTIVDNLNRLNRIRFISEKELSGVFTSEEWKFFFDSLNGLVIDDALSCNAGVLIAHCEDSESLEGTASKWGVNIEALKDKISSLKGANVESIYNRVERFWASPDNSLEDWSVL